MTNCDPGVVREACDGDGDGVWTLTCAFATSFAPSREVFDRSFDLVLSDPETLLLVAEQPTRGIVGYLLAHRHPTLFANGPVAWVEELMVDASTRGVGIGRQLMARAEAWAAVGGAPYLALATRRAGGFYQALGYEDSAVFYRKLLGT